MSCSPFRQGDAHSRLSHRVGNKRHAQVMPPPFSGLGVLPAVLSGDTPAGIRLFHATAVAPGWLAFRIQSGRSGIARATAPRAASGAAVCAMGARLRFSISQVRNIRSLKRMQVTISPSVGWVNSAFKKTTRPVLVYSRLARGGLGRFVAFCQQHGKWSARGRAGARDRDERGRLRIPCYWRKARKPPSHARRGHVRPVRQGVQNNESSAPSPRRLPNPG